MGTEVTLIYGITFLTVLWALMQTTTGQRIANNIDKVIEPVIKAAGFLITAFVWLFVMGAMVAVALAIGPLWIIVVLLILILLSTK